MLQTKPEGSLAPVESLEYEGGYPIARLTYQDAALPVLVRLEAFNPMIPLDTVNSSIPCAIFRFTVQNPGKTAAEVALFATLQNAVGSRGANGIRGVRFNGYGGNRNRVVREKGRVTVAMDKSPDPVFPGTVKVRSASGQEVPGPELLWLTGTAGLTAQTAEPLSRIAADGGVALVEGTSKGFFDTIAALRSNRTNLAGIVTIFEDFEKPKYEGWTITGNAFGKGPSRGTEAGQQPVLNFGGRRLVNTFIQGDGPQGTATSKPFRIEQRYIGFLIGGGSHPGQTCINLRIGDKVVRTATGKNRETLEPVAWDVADLKGKEAMIEIVDRSSEPWGHINIDQIAFSDISPEPFLKQGTATELVAKAIGLPLAEVEAASLPAGQSILLAEHAPPALKAIAGGWQVTRYTRLRGFQSGDGGYRVLATTPGGRSAGDRRPAGQRPNHPGAGARSAVELG